MAIPFVDLTRVHDGVREELHQAALECIDSCHYIGGEYVKRFEREMAAWNGVDEICGVSCGTMGAFSLLKSFGIGQGDEVITTVHTAIATAESITLTGARVVFADIRPGWFYLDPDDVERRITPRTKAIVPVHLYGQPVDMKAFLDIARRHGLILIEDCAQAQGAYCGDAMVGTMGGGAIWSFFPSKNLGGFGDGGAVTAKDPAVLKRARMFSNHGRESKYLHEFEGINSRLDALQAAMLSVLLPRVNDFNARRRAAAKRYDEALAGIDEVVTPKVLPGTTPVYHLYVIVVPDREALAEHLKGRGIDTAVHYPVSLNVLPAYAHLGQGEGSFPNAEYACEHMLSLPMHPAITDAEVDEVAAAVRAFYGR